MTKLLAGLFSALLTTSAIAGLVEINSSQYIRESGSPSPQTLEVSLENEGEIRVSNINLQDADFELSDSTQIYLNGSAILSPFQVPYGGYVVFPLSAGTHYLEVTLRGKPGGGLEVAFYENKPDAPVQGKGWELLDDGTVLHRKTGLIWHRNLSSPGWPSRVERQDSPAGSCYFYKGCRREDEYISKLNSGEYGSDAVNGNAGYTDWRIPTADELLSAMDYRAFPPLTDANGDIGDGVLYDPDIGTNIYQGMTPGEPLLFSVESNYEPGPYEFVQELNVYSLISQSSDPRNGDYRLGEVYDYDYPCTFTVEFAGYTQEFLWCSPYGGDVWPIRGGQQEN
jgi:hypothetical protein